MISSPIWRNADLGHSHQLGNSDSILMQRETSQPTYCHPPPWWSPPPWCCYSPSCWVTNQGFPAQSWCRKRQSPIMPVLATMPTYLGKNSHLVLGIFVQVWWQLTDHLGSGKIAIVVCRYLVRYLCRREERRSEGMHGLSLPTKSQELCNPKTVRHQKIKLRIEHNLNVETILRSV